MTTTPSAGLDDARRALLERIVVRARVLLEDDLSAQAEGRFGIHLDGAIEDEATLPDNTTDKVTRRELVEIVAHLRMQGEDDPASVARLLREAAFTQLNRLIAIRIAEEIGLLPESLARGSQSQGFKDLGEIMPVLAGDYRAYLRLCGDELAADAPALFDPRNPLLALEPSTAAFDALVVLLADPAASEIWSAPDTLGWAYQFFNTSEERREMREASAPRNSRELAVRNQFFTPRYVVDFLVQNTIGRRLIENDPASPLLEEMPLLVDPPTEQGPALDLEDVKCLDPACGSGHFLLGCYDLLERAWEIDGVAPSEAAPRIVASLWGVDIDVRCAQVASAALILRARRHCRDLLLPRPNVITARGLPGGSAALPPDLELTSGQRNLIDRVSTVLADAPLLGTLLKAEEALDQEIRHGVFGGNAGTLELTKEAAEATERELLSHLQAIADHASSSVVERLLATEADDALRLVDVVRQRYDVVLMNPPYGTPAEGTEPFLQGAYPETWTELYACFVTRGLDLLRPSSYLGALTSSQYFVTRRLATFRSNIIRNHRPVALIDLGAGVLDATVNTAVCILSQSRSVGRTNYLDATRMPPAEKVSVVTDPRLHMQTRDVLGFDAIPNSPLALHMPDSLVAMWDEAARLEPALAKIRTGGKSFDDARFVRASWEVSPEGMRRGWRRYLKGGEYQPYVSWSHLLIDWRDDGRELRRLGTEEGRLAQIMQSFAYWGRAGLCYPRVSSVGFAACIMPKNEIFGEKSIAILPNDDVDPIVLLGLLNSTPVAEILQVFGRGRATENGSMKSLPFERSVLGELAAIRPHVVELCEVFSDVERRDETSSTFISPLGLSSNLSAIMQVRTEWQTTAAAAQAKIDEAVRAVLSIEGRLDPDLPSRVDLVQRALTDRNVRASHSTEILSYILGAAFGRWDVRIGTKSPQTLATSYFEPVPDCPPGMLVGSDGMPAKEAPAGYPIKLPPTRLLVDEPGHPWDVEASVLRAAAVLFDDPSTIVAELLQILRRGSVREHLRKQFFKDHLSRYSKSRRKAPIYWPLTIPSKDWGVWVYAPTFTRETLFAVANEAKRRERLAGEAISRLQREQHENGAGRPARRMAEELDKEQKLAEELRLFRAEAERIAGLGWEPDLDDGIILCAAPLADLFPSWPDAKRARADLRNSKYEWATVAAWADRI